MSEPPRRVLGALLVLACGLLSGASVPVGRAHDRVYALVAARDLNPGVTITADDLVAVAIDADLLPNGVMIAPEQVIGRRPHERVLANEFVRAERIADVDAGTGINGTLPRGYRAITVEVVDDDLLDGLLPGALVDVRLTLPNARPWELEPAREVELLAVHRPSDGSSPDTGSDSRPSVAWVTLRVADWNAAHLAAAERTGPLHLALHTWGTDLPAPVVPVGATTCEFVVVVDPDVSATPRPPRTAPGVRSR
jgi:Flp pilus assembly protein CpaB